MAYEAFCQSIQGAGHIKKGMPCEDYGIKFENDRCTIFALGDGHGDVNCPRSSFGSKSICEIAVDELRMFAEQIENQRWEERLLDQYDAQELINQLVTSIFGKWSCRVNEDFAQNPLSEKEEAEAAEYIERYRRGERIEHIYGTTFIAGLLMDKYLLLLQQGDGRCVVFDSDGNATQPIPWDDRCFANVTTSLCDTDAVQSCRYHVIDIKKKTVIACVAGSDGVEDSFLTMDKMHTYYREKLLFASNVDIAEFENHLLETMPVVSEEGSSDDITICGFFDRELVKEKEDKFLADNEAVIVNDKIRKAQGRIDSMGPKLAFLHKKCTEAMTQYSNLVNRYSELDTEYASIKMDLDAYAQNKSNGYPAIRGWVFSTASIRCLQKRMVRIVEEKEELAKEIQAALDKKKICDDEYHVYKQRYDGYASVITEHEAKIKKLGSSPDDQSDEQVPEADDSVDSSQKATSLPDETSTLSVKTVPNEREDGATESDVPAVDTGDSDSENLLAEGDNTAEITEALNAPNCDPEGEQLPAETMPQAVAEAEETQDVPGEKEKKAKSGFFSSFKRNKPQ